MAAFVPLFGENLVDRFGNTVKTQDALHDKGVALYILDQSARTPCSSASTSSRSSVCARHFAASMHAFYPCLVNKGVEVVCLAAPATALALPSSSLKLDHLRASNVSLISEDAEHVSNVIQTLKSSDMSFINIIGSAEALLEGKAERCALRKERESRLEPIVELEPGAARVSAASRDLNKEQVTQCDEKEDDNVAEFSQASAHEKVNDTEKSDNKLSFDLCEETPMSSCSKCDLHSTLHPSRGTGSVSFTADGSPLAETGVIGQPPPKFSFVPPQGDAENENFTVSGDDESKTWLHLPVTERVAASSRLCAQFQVTILPALIVFNAHGDVVTKDGRGRLLSNPEAFPYSPNSLNRSFTSQGKTGSLLPPQFNLGPLDPKAIDGACLGV